MKKSILVYGAGAIGRGYLPWVFLPERFDYYYVEKNDMLRKTLNKNKLFTTHKIVDGRYVSKTVPVRRCYGNNEEIKRLNDVDVIVTAVGPRNTISLYENLKNTSAPVICFENDANLPDILSSITDNPNTVFGIPDVITSNTAPQELLSKDRLSIVTEDGICFIDNRVSFLGGNCSYVDKAELRKQWLAKLYIHNTSHCIAAYLGYLSNVKYLHEAMHDDRILRIVSGAIKEIKGMLLIKYKLDKQFVEWYSDKELRRFRNTLLYDPIDRVAREPLRKLEPNERLVGAAEECLCCGVIPENIIIGITAAFCYENPSDPDYNIKYLMKSLEPSDFLQLIIRLRKGEPLFEILLRSWKENILKLRSLRHG